MKDKIEQNITKEGLIKLLQEQDAELQIYEKEQRDKLKEAQDTEVALMEKQREIERKQNLEAEIAGQKTSNLLQKYASEAAIKKTEIRKSQEELELIDQELLELLNSTKNRIGKLAYQFIDLNKEKTILLADNQLEAKETISNDMKSVSRYYENSIKRSQQIIDEEVLKERRTKKNMDILTKTIDITLIKEDDDIAQEIDELV